jgi:hypothetical protein
VVIISSFFVMVLVALLYFVRYGHTLNSDYVLVVSGKAPFQSDTAREAVQRSSTEARLRSFEVQDDRFEMVFELRLSEEASMDTDALIAELKSLSGVVEVSLMAPQLALPL